MDFKDTFISVCNLLVLPLMMPISIIVLKVLRTHNEFKTKLTYFILFVIILLDCVHMVTTFLEAIMDFGPAHLTEILGSFGCWLRVSYLTAMSMLEFLLATNRIASILNCKGSKKTNICLKVTIPEISSVALFLGFDCHPLYRSLSLASSC
ncbi:hypothetical protein L596_029305 [Steinernema carpocapsae]|uniref:G-protein coupled receptors family 1 profile domain-containing protein n=1 Tax=Steinernema carpocapsae TaxID=34508 RepID=A0A4U5LU89_STECR|nr:hypothetical protein L596_029305 [Steinernema carpocapsae]